MSRLVLASASPRRHELLRALVEDFDVVVSNTDESSGESGPAARAVDIALAKARAVAGQHPDATIIGADTIVDDGTREYGKPSGADDARDMLRALRGRTHRVATGVAVIAGGEEHTAAGVARVTLAELPDESIEAYIASGRPLDKAGAYAIQDEDVPVVASFAGCYCAVMGLPLWTLRNLLGAAGCDTADPGRCYARCATCPDSPGEDRAAKAGLQTG
ncbi:MAG: Maf family protein [Dehalococcoidia bacterium]|nr:Maf family protein [Dehalococcoidia bacterium]